MSNTQPTTGRSWFGKFSRLLDAGRRLILNLVFLLLIVMIVVALFKSRGPALADKTALVLDLQGIIVEQQTDDLRATAMQQLRGQDMQKTQLRDLLTVLDAAAKDANISHVVLVLDEFQGTGLASLREVATALDRFKVSGKKVIAWGSSYDQRQYFLAAHASEVFIHPMGMVFLEGFGRYRNYYRDALDKVGVSVNLIRVGTYKSAAEPFIANASSPAAKEAESFLYKGLWSTYTEGVEKARKLPAGALMGYINGAPEQLAAVSGDSAKLALQAKLVDGIKTRDELRELLIQRGAKDDDQATGFRQISFGDYLARQRPSFTGDAVGVVVAEGEIVDGVAPAGLVGGRSTAALIRKAREDSNIKALVLRVNSPGGSAFGSELVRRELELTRQAGKPVVVSMGDLAASGGYWMSMAADQVIADAATITGSIGVFALLPTADQAMDKLGVHTDGAPTTWLGGAGDPRRPLDPRFASMVQSSIDHIYADFTAKAAQARQTTPEKINEVAQGRVWTGAQAKERGLVDKLGSYGDALKAAAVRAKLSEGYRVTYLEREPGKLAGLLRALGGDAALAWAHQVDLNLLPLGAPPEIADDLRRDLGLVTDLGKGRKPFSVSAHCLCEAF
ncbi:signal peptide peptidase SppA [Aquabacterium sp.]|uniref:signal peptide peptidase SppA n=1 Tax=Aquabacterium sp. TaxID=1872578 RepID=UPI00248A305B|nr:signal peptide peptidase SppA [Aquabacterium sp.]MDI1259655.1 signal peptide peptidase SppA [Aquabacterium sp.]